MGERCLPLLLLLLLGSMSGLSLAGSEKDSEELSEKGLRTLSPEEVEEYPFDIIDTEPTVSTLSMGQRYLLSQWRQNIADLV